MFEFGTAGSCHGGGVGEESALASTVSATHAHPLGPPGVGLWDHHQTIVNFILLSFFASRTIGTINEFIVQQRI